MAHASFLVEVGYKWGLFRPWPSSGTNPESDPGSHPAEMMEAALCFFAIASSAREVPYISVNVETVDKCRFPFKIDGSYLRMLRVGVLRMATSILPKLIYVGYYLYIVQLSGFVVDRSGAAYIY